MTAATAFRTSRPAAFGSSVVVSEVVAGLVVVVGLGLISPGAVAG